MEGNLTKGPILKTLTKLAIPIMASSFLGTLYNITDMAWIGLLGAKAVAGVGVGGMFTWLSQGLASMARMGGQVQISQCIGRGEKEKAHGYAQTAMQLALLMGLAYGIIVALFANQLVGFFKLDDAETLSAALDYTKIACGFIVFSFLSFTLTGIYTAQGDSKTPFIANLFGLAASGRRSDGNCFGTGNCYNDYAVWSYITEEGKCVERSSLVCKNSVGICAGNLQNRYSYCTSGYGVLFYLYGIDAYGSWFWSRGNCYAACGRSD